MLVTRVRHGHNLSTSHANTRKIRDRSTMTLDVSKHMCARLGMYVAEHTATMMKTKQRLTIVIRDSAGCDTNDGAVLGL